MHVPTGTPVPMTVEEYLEFDRRSAGKHELVDGMAYAMASASTPHNRIGLNIAFRLMAAAEGGPCRVYHEGVKLRVRDDFYYPDVMAVCERGGDDLRMAYAPCLIIEVLSPTTERHDRTAKLGTYQSIPSLRAYLLVGQDSRFVVRHWREDASAPWRREDLAGDGDVPVPCPAGTVLTFDQIYRGLDVQPPPPRPALRLVREDLAEYETVTTLSTEQAWDE